MEHISDRRFVHKDLACRNVVIGPDFRVKITSLSLQNDLFMQEYYTYKNVLVVPLRFVKAKEKSSNSRTPLQGGSVFHWKFCTLDLNESYFCEQNIVRFNFLLT